MNERLYLNIAGFNIQIIFHKISLSTELNFIKKAILKVYKGFLLSKSLVRNIDFTISFFEPPRTSTISFKNAHYMKFYELINQTHIITSHSISIFQFNVIIRAIIGLLLKKDSFVLHASACLVGEEALLFIGGSGDGKSTVIRLLRKKYKALGDDSVIIRKLDRNYFMYQTPFTERQSWVQKNKGKYLIGKIFILKKAINNKIVRCNNRSEILKKFIEEFLVYNDKNL